MEVLVEPLLDEKTLESFCLTLRQNEEHWVSGHKTAGWYAKTVKNNRQLAINCALYRQLSVQLHQLLMNQPLMNSMVFPKAIHSLIFSRSGPGEGYGRHLDSVRMPHGRTDLSFTVALSDPEDYEGGDLVLEMQSVERRFQLSAGDVVIYPSTLLHRVEPVQSGERFVAVGWIQSRIRRADQRELLFELDRARRLQFINHGKDDVFDLVSRSYNNLFRLWDEG